MELKDTIELMQSADYKDRFIAEYLQTKIRCDKLHKMLMQYREGTLPFKPTCPYDVLYKQLIFMSEYQDTLIERADIEGISLIDCA